MNTTTGTFRFSSFLGAGLLMLAGVFSDVLPTTAQAQEACPLPAGATAVMFALKSK